MADDITKDMDIARATPRFNIDFNSICIILHYFFYGSLLLPRGLQQVQQKAPYLQDDDIDGSITQHRLYTNSLNHTARELPHAEMIYHITIFKESDMNRYISIVLTIQLKISIPNSALVISLWQITDFAINQRI